MSSKQSIQSTKVSKIVVARKNATSSAADITTFPREILQAIFSNLEPKDIKQTRQVCWEWSLSSEPFLLRRAYSALREGTMSALLHLSNHEGLRRYVKEIVVDARMFARLYPDEAEETLRSTFKPEGRKQGYKEFNALRAAEEFMQLYDDQEWMIDSGNFTAWLRYALERMPNVASILITEVNSTWYFFDGPLSRDVNYAPWPVPICDGIDRLVRVVLNAVWQVRDSQNAARITSFTTGLGYDCQKVDIERMTMINVLLSPRLPAAQYLLRNLKRLSIDLGPLSNDATNSFAFASMLGDAHELEELELRLGNARLWPMHVEGILLHKNWPLLTRLALEGAHFDFIQMTTMLAEHGNLKQLHLVCVSVEGGSWADIVPILSSMPLEGIFLQCLSHNDGNDWEYRCESSCRRDDLETAILGSRVNRMEAQTDMICPFGEIGRGN